MTPAEGDRSPAAYAAAADALAVGVLGALRGGVGSSPLVARHVDSSSDALVALAAVRVVGADTFSPHVLVGAAFHAADAAAVARSFTAFPPAVTAPVSARRRGTSARTDERTAAWRDWATAQLLARFGGAHVSVPVPEHDGALADTSDWQRWSVRMAQLSPLAIPGLDGPVHEAARRAALPLGRGATRSVLRGDFATAARLVRWLARLHHDRVALPLDAVPVLEHVHLLGGASPRTALDIAVARHLLGAEPPEGGA